MVTVDYYALLKIVAESQDFEHLKHSLTKEILKQLETEHAKLVVQRDSLVHTDPWPSGLAEAYITTLEEEAAYWRTFLPQGEHE